MNIGEISARSGVSQRSLRYYEQQGLVTPQRGPNGYRQYAESDVIVVQTIRTMYEIGFSREAVSAVLPCAVGDPGEVDPAAVRTRVEAMRDELAARIEDLTRTHALLVDFLEPTTTDCAAEAPAAWASTSARVAGLGDVVRPRTGSPRSH